MQASKQQQPFRTPMEWPEQTQRVQSLSESGLSVIPERYIKPPTERPSSVENSATGVGIPLIDLSGLDNDVRRPATIQAMQDACINWGFFQVFNHKISPDLLHRMREAWRSFFHLPLDEKQVYANNPRTYEGYGSRIGVEKGAILDWGDYFFLHLLPPRLRDPNKWPSPNYCRETIAEYAEEVTGLCGRLLKVLSIGLGQRESLLLDGFGGELSTCMRVNYYPKCPQPDLTLGLSAHSDPGGMTILLPDDHVTGLQVRKGDKWITIVPYPHSLIINIADQIQVVSNGIYKSVEHRVVVNPHMERLSVAFFCNPKPDIAVGPADELVTNDRPARYKPMTFDEYRLYIRRRGPRGKSQVQSLTNSNQCSSS